MTELFKLRELIDGTLASPEPLQVFAVAQWIRELVRILEKLPTEQQVQRELKIAAMPIDEIYLSVRAKNGLARAGITTVGELLSKTPDELLAIRHFGYTSLNEVRDRLAADFRMRLRGDGNI